MKSLITICLFSFLMACQTNNENEQINKKFDSIATMCENLKISQILLDDKVNNLQERQRIEDGEKLWLWLRDYSDFNSDNLDTLVEKSLIVFAKNYEKRKINKSLPLITQVEVKGFLNTNGLLNYLLQKSESINYTDKELNRQIILLYNIFIEEKIDNDLRNRINKIIEIEIPSKEKK